MDATISSFYPISLDDIKLKVLRREKSSHNQPVGLFDLNTFRNIRIARNGFGEEVVKVEGNIPVDLEIANGKRFLFISHDQSYLTHGLHSYPAKFFPELPRWIIKRYSQEGEIVLDPFAGSGTTNLEALLLRRHSVGVDVDPFSRFISKVKTTPLDVKELQSAQEQLLKAIVRFDPRKTKGLSIPEFPYRDSWFNKEIILELAYIKKCIGRLKVNSRVKDYFMVCFSSIIRSVSNADDHCTRTVIRKRLKKEIYPSMALRKFAEAIIKKTPRMIDFSTNHPKNIQVNIPEGMDARAIRFPDETFDLAVTSPPYVNAVDYPRTHQLEIYWLGLANGSLANLKKEHVGTESVSTEDYSYLHLLGITEADTKIKKIFNKDPRRAYIAYKYLLDIKKNLKEVYRVLKKDSRYVIVVGNNRIRNEVFENWKYLMAIGKQIGFKIESYFGSEIIKHFIKVPRRERINTDWVIALRK